MDVPVAVAGWSNQAETFLTLIDSYKTKEMFCDCTLACKEKFFRAHKMILAMCSELFEKIFLTTQDKNPVIILHEIEAWQIECLLNYMYKGETCVSDGNFLSLCRVATYLQIKGFDKLEKCRQAVKAAKQKDRLLAASFPSAESSWKMAPRPYPLHQGSESKPPEYLRESTNHNHSSLFIQTKDLAHVSVQESHVNRPSSSSHQEEVNYNHRAKLPFPQAKLPPPSGQPTKQDKASTGYHQNAPENRGSQKSVPKLDLNHNSADNFSPQQKFSFPSKFSPEFTEFKDAKLYWQSKYRSEMKVLHSTDPRKDISYSNQSVYCSSKNRDAPNIHSPRRTPEDDFHQQTPQKEPWTSYEDCRSPFEDERKPQNAYPYKQGGSSKHYGDHVPKSFSQPTPTGGIRGSTGASPPELQTALEKEPVLIKVENEDDGFDTIERSAEYRESISPTNRKEPVSQYNPSRPSCHANDMGEDPRDHSTTYQQPPSAMDRDSRVSFSYSRSPVPKKLKTGVLRAPPPLLKIVSSEPSCSDIKVEKNEPGSAPKFSTNDPLLQKIPTNKRKRVRGPKSWEFLLRLLRSQSCNPSLVKWEDEEAGVFRLIKPEVIAQRWGQRTGKHDHDVLSYESFSRGLRYHYATGALCAVSEKSFVYQFGPKAQKALKSLIHSSQSFQ